MAYFLKFLNFPLLILKNNFIIFDRLNLFSDSVNAVISVGLETGVRSRNAEDDLISL